VSLNGCIRSTSNTLLASTFGLDSACRQFIKIGRPGYKVTKVRDPQTARLGLLFQVMLPEIKEGERPRKRFMSSFEQRKEVVNRSIQYLLVGLHNPFLALGSDGTDRIMYIIEVRLQRSRTRRSPLPSRQKSSLRRRKTQIRSGRTGIPIPR
jgi:hypothetical protein